MTRNKPTGSSLISTKGAAERYGVARSTIRRWAKEDSYHGKPGDYGATVYPEAEVHKSAEKRGHITRP